MTVHGTPPGGAPIRARVIVASNRAAAGVYPDRTGPLVVAGLRAFGCTVPGPVVVGDGDPVAAALRAAIAEGCHLVLTAGGTGVSPTDRTPEATAPLLDRRLPGIPEAIRAHGAGAGTPTAVLSRGLAGVAGRTVIVNLPGSPGGVRDGLTVLGPLLGHLVGHRHGAAERGGLS